MKPDTIPHPGTAIVTGAFSYTGRYITRRLLDEGVHVRTLTGHPDRQDPFGGQVEAAPLDFSDPDGLHRSMRGASVLFNTYWVRFERGRPLSTARSKIRSRCSKLPRGRGSAG